MATREFSLDQVSYQTWKRTLQLLQQISLSVIFQESVRNQLLELEIVHEIIRLNTKVGDLASLSLTHFCLNLFLYRSVILVTLVISVTPISLFFCRAHASV